MGFEFASGPHVVSGDGEYFSFDKADSPGLSISGYDRLFDFTSGVKKTFYVGTDTFYVWQDGHTPKLKLMICPDSIPGEISFADSIRASMETMSQNRISGDRLNYDMTIGNYNVKINVRKMSGIVFPDSINVRSMNTYILLRRTGE
jgi:hypothetical protein